MTDEVTVAHPVRISQRNSWSGTWNNYPEGSVDALAALFDAREFKYVIGREVGSENGVPHLQICVKGKRGERWRPSELDIPGGWSQIHWSGTRDVQASFAYCRKESNYVSNIEERRVVKRITFESLRPWQKEIAQAFASPCEDTDRTIHWFVDEVGGAGKTWVSRYLVQNLRGIYIGGGNRHACFAMARAAAERDVRICIFDIGRSDTISYRALENMKDGIIFCGHGAGPECGQHIFPSVHVVVFSNTYPEQEMLSQDRWRVVNLDEYRAEHSERVNTE